jgi:hypothetical protein
MGVGMQPARLTAGIAVIFALATFAGGRSTGAAATNNLQGDRTGMRNSRYCELFVIRRNVGSPDAEVYNTLGLNDCPAAAWARVDATALKEELNAAVVIRNGPRYFLMDSSSFEVPGQAVSFDGLPMRLVAHIALPPGSLLPWKKREPYTITTIRRTTRWTYDAGKPAYELTDPGGATYVMQSYAQIVDPHLTPDSLASLATRLKLPPGWRYRQITPEAPLNVVSLGGTAYVIQDDLQNSYQRSN